MFLNLRKKGAFVLALLVAATAVFTVSCQKELSGGGFLITETPPDLTSKISSSVSGFVTDENDAAVQGATVAVGFGTTTTDKYGYFEVSNAEVVKNAAVVTVTKSGYFKGIKTYIASTGKSAFFRIKLLPKTTAGNFDAAAGGTVTLTNGLSISFPAGAVRLAAGGTYTGQVTVAAQWLNPTAAELPLTMPGDLRGLDSLGFMRVLTTYGMSATELTGSAGELLQIADGKKAAVTFPLPAALASSAPATIPLWHFNENAGLWVQEGHAVKSGSNYTGNVSHFSYWNCDLPNATVPLTFTVVNAGGDPIGNTYVDIVPTSSNSWSHAGGYTDATGYVNILVTANTDYKMSIHGDCGNFNTPAYTQNFSVGTTAVNLGNITVTGSSLATVSGTVECSGSPLADAYVVMKRGYFNYRYPVASDGSYSFTTTLCAGSEPVILLAENLSTMQAGDPVDYTLVPGNNTVPTLAACVVSINQFINYTLDGVVTNITYPTDSINHYVNPQSTPPSITVSSDGGTLNFVSLSFTNNGIAAGGTQMLLSFFSRDLPDSATIAMPIQVNITEYGNVGEFIAGNFSGTLTGAPPANTPHAIDCNFRVRRSE